VTDYQVAAPQKEAHLPDQQLLGAALTIAQLYKISGG
jgi:hypothetical protein